MPNYNSVILIGHATKDAEVRYTPDGKPITSFSIAWNRNFQREGTWESEPHFFDVVCFRECEGLTKGAAVLVEGRLSQDRWKDKDSGEMRSKVKVIANKVYVLGKKDKPAENNQTDSDIPF